LVFQLRSQKWGRPCVEKLKEVSMECVHVFKKKKKEKTEGGIWE